MRVWSLALADEIRKLSGVGTIVFGGSSEYK